MRLVNLYLTGYRRFASRTKINLDGKLIALLGPNEAGKSTILEALTRLADADPISQRDRTRPSEPAESDLAIEAVWLLESDDLAAIEVPNGCEAPRWFSVGKRMDGIPTWDINPELRRDQDPRKRAVQALRRIATSKWVAAVDAAAGDAEEISLFGEIDATVAALESDDETLSQDAINQVGTLINRLAPVVSDAPRYALALPAELERLIEHEIQTDPTTAAIGALASRLPRIVRFELNARELASFYDLREVADTPPLALSNVARLAGLNLVELRQLVENGDSGGATELLDATNANLRERIDEAWGQTEIEPRFIRDEFILRILVKTNGGKLQDIAERSDGLRTFLSLVAFTSEIARDQQPVLLVDEAEIHLHYDAQADLVQMLARQHQARQVIYTTHSAGCLPPDLGTGVRIVVPDATEDRSRVENWPWTLGSGFDPLLLGMGASTMAFVPTRAAVIGEGAGEVVLLPTLMREAMSLESLEFQVAPGAAEASKRAVAMINLQGSRVAWLVDGDAGGAANRKHLKSCGIPAERIITLGGINSGLAVEDLVDIDVYVEAVNEELRRSHGDASAVLTSAALGDAGRTAAVAAWCEERTLAPPAKGYVAHRIAEKRSDRSLIASSRLDLLRELHNELVGLITGVNTQV